MSANAIPINVRCPVCNGTGQEVKSTAIWPGKKLVYRICRVCGGSGRIKHRR
jgi:DnaJ-class molecular chaperone